MEKKEQIYYQLEELIEASHNLQSKNNIHKHLCFNSNLYQFKFDIFNKIFI